MKGFARVVAVCAAAAMFAPGATAQDDLPPAFKGRQWKPPEPDPDNEYVRTNQRPGANQHALASYLVMAGVFGALAAVVFLRDTRMTLLPRRRRPWDP